VVSTKRRLKGSTAPIAPVEGGEERDGLGAVRPSYSRPPDDRLELTNDLPVAPERTRSSDRAQGPPSAHPRRLLSKEEVLDITGCSYASIYHWMKAGRFPLAIELGARHGRSAKIAWHQHEIEEWIASRPRRELGRRKQQAA
jgi:predicted DNA-binding transcriptional regulator AlpA